MSDINVVEVIWHDLGRHVHCYGWDSVRSPNVDHFAQEGVVFDNAFCTAPLCSPSRAARITGRYPHANGVIGLVHRGWRFNPGEVFLPAQLSNHGYDTLLVNFQHEMPHGSGRELGYEATVEGCGDASVPWMFRTWIESRPEDAAPFYASLGFTHVHRPHGNGAYREGEPESVQLPPYVPDLPEFRRDLAGYEALIEEADSWFGEILATLRETGHEEDTLVVFTTDHGTDLPRAKSTLYDAGIGIALIMRLPGELPAGTRVAELVSNVDYMPMITEALGVPAPEQLHGTSFWPLALGPADPSRDAVFATRTWHATYDPIRCIRTQNYKLIRNFRPGKPYLIPPELIETVGKEVLESHFQEIRPEYEFYDMEHDPAERVNRSGDPAYAAVEADLGSVLERFLQETNDPILQGDVPHPGRHSDVWDWRKTRRGWELYKP